MDDTIKEILAHLLGNKTQIAALVKSNASLQAKNEVLEKKLGDVKEDFIQLEGDYGTIKSDHDRFNNDHGKLQSFCTVLKADHDELKTSTLDKIDSLKDTISSLKTNPPPPPP